MSYCHLTSKSVGYSNIKFWLGLVGHYGYHSERVNQRIRATLDSRRCLTTYASAATNQPASTPRDSSGNAVAATPSETHTASGDKQATAPGTIPGDDTTGFPEIFINPNGTFPFFPEENSTCFDSMDPSVVFSDGHNHTCYELSHYGFCQRLQSPYCARSCGRCTIDDRKIDGYNSDDIDDTSAEVLFNQGKECLANKGKTFFFVTSCNHVEGMLSTRLIDLDASMRALDDFVVPAGETWDLKGIFFFVFSFYLFPRC